MVLCSIIDWHDLHTQNISILKQLNDTAWMFGSVKNDNALYERKYLDFMTRLQLFIVFVVAFLLYSFLFSFSTHFLMADSNHFMYITHCWFISFSSASLFFGARISRAGKKCKNTPFLWSNADNIFHFISHIFP